MHIVAREAVPFYSRRHRSPMSMPSPVPWLVPAFDALDSKFLVYYSALTPERRWSDDKF